MNFFRPTRCAALSLYVFGLLTGRAAETTVARNPQELAGVLQRGVPGDTIVMANGVWNDLTLRWIRSGTAEQPITLRAEHSGQVFIEGKSSLRSAGITSWCRDSSSGTGTRPRAR